MKHETGGTRLWLALLARKPWVWVIGFCGILVGCASPEYLQNPKQTGLDFVCAVGDVTPTEAIVWLKANGPQPLTVRYGTDPRGKKFFTTDEIFPKPQNDFIVKTHLTGLSPKTHYVYRGVVQGKQPGQLCQFVTAPAPEDLAQVTFVIGGDVRDSFRPFTIMSEMRIAKPDFFIFLGDTIYSDKGKMAIELADYWRKYAENRDGSMQRLLAETSVYAMWDDHEVASDFISTHPRMPIGRQAFFDYWPIRVDSQDPHRLYRSFRWGQAVELFLLDTRQYRNPSTLTMLGNRQKHWLMDRLKSSSAAVKFIATSVPFSDPGKDKWGEYPQERDEILNFIQRQGITGILFLATDVHHGAVANVPGPLGLKELIFGPLAMTMNYKINGEDSRFEYFNDEYRNYGKITVHSESSKWIVNIDWFTEGNVLLHQVVLSEDSSRDLISVNSEMQNSYSGK